MWKVAFDILVAAWRFFTRSGFDEKKTNEKDTVSQNKERGENAVNPDPEKRILNNFQEIKKGTSKKEREGDTDYNHSRQGDSISSEAFEKN
jgi:hypothetical protein